MKLTQLARKILEDHFKDKEFIPDKETKKEFNEKKACFITLTKNSELRGCIGSLEATQELWRDVQENVIGAAFHDSRFKPLKENELNDLQIEVSVLTKPKKMEAKNSKFLLDKIDKDMGIILQKGNHSATFLPQVWKEIPNKEEFLEQLSIKAGLDKEEWKGCEIFYYNVDKFEE